MWIGNPMKETTLPSLFWPFFSSMFLQGESPCDGNTWQNGWGGITVSFLRPCGQLLLPFSLTLYFHSFLSLDIPWRSIEGWMEPWNRWELSIYPASPAVLFFLQTNSPVTIRIFWLNGICFTSLLFLILFLILFLFYSTSFLLVWTKISITATAMPPEIGLHEAVPAKFQTNPWLSPTFLTSTLPTSTF